MCVRRWLTPPAASSFAHWRAPAPPRRRRPRAACPAPRRGAVSRQACGAPSRDNGGAQRRALAAASLSAKASAEVVLGKLLSGMSTSVVTPPAAAAFVPVKNPSQSALPMWRQRDRVGVPCLRCAHRPGSFKCVWTSTSPCALRQSDRRLSAPRSCSRAAPDLSPRHRSPARPRERKQCARQP